MEEAKKTQKTQEKVTPEMFGQVPSRAIATMTVWADANERVLGELVEFSAATAKEGVRLYAELQQGVLEALRDSQAAAARVQNAWQAGVSDPAAVYQKILSDGVDGAQKAFTLLEGQAKALARSAERLQTSAEHAGKDIHATYTNVISKLKDVYSQS